MRASASLTLPPITTAFTDCPRCSSRALHHTGEIKLSNLHLREDVLQKELRLPMRVVDGVLGSVKVSVSWTKLLSSPIVVDIDESTYRQDGLRRTEAKP